jgi:hypothetical protein
VPGRGAACSLFHGDALSRDAAAGFEHLQNREPPAVSEIVDTAPSARTKGVQGQEMCFHKVHDVQIIPDAGSVRGVIVVAEDGDGGTSPHGRIENQGNEVCLRVVGFADASVQGGPASVEIAQRTPAKIVGDRRPVKKAFHRQFRLTVGIRRTLGRVLRNGNQFRLAVHRRRGGKNKIFHTMAHHGLKEPQHTLEVVVVIGKRIAHALPHLNERGEMKHRVHPVLAEEAPQQRRIPNVALNERNGGGDKVPMPCGKIVQNENILASLQKATDHVTADIARTATDENRHDAFLLT